jgi:hypothetical protein
MEEEIVSPNRWKKPLIATGIVAIVAICGFAAATSQTDLGRAASDYEKNKADAKKEGIFFTRQQVEAQYQIPESENGANLVASILPLVRKYKIEGTKTITEQIVQDNWTELGPAIDKLEQASHRPSLMFKRDFSNPAATLFPEFSDAKHWLTLLVQLGHLSAEKGDAAKAQKYWELASYLAKKMDDEGLLIGMLVRIACLAIIERELQQNIQIHGKDPAILSAIDAVLKKLDQPYNLKKPLSVEHWFGTSSIDAYIKDPGQFIAMSGSNAMPNEIRFGRYLPRFKIANLSRIHKFYADGVRSIPQDPYDLVGIDKAFSGMDQVAMKNQGLSYTMLNMIAPVFSNCGLAISKEIAQRNVLFQSIALLKTGADPASGLPLNGRYAMDVDGKSIRIKKGATGWLVYSVGMDKVDDGGAALKNGKGDFVVHLPN